MADMLEHSERALRKEELLKLDRIEPEPHIILGEE